MHSSHNRSRRQSNNKGEDYEALPLSVSQVDEPRSEPYSRRPQTSHHTERHKPPHTSGKSSYDTSREASSSRHHDQDDWRSSDVSNRSSHDRYNYSSSKDAYHTATQDAYHSGESRDSDVWSNQSVGSGREWTKRYDHPRSTPSHTDSVGWNGPSTYGNRTPTYDQWRQDDGRSTERNVSRTAAEDRRPDGDVSGWHQDEPRDSQLWVRDSGWDSRRHPNRGKEWSESRRWNNTRQEDSQRSSDERSWEPAATWSSNRSESQDSKNQNGHKNDHSYRTSKGGKKAHTHNRQKRDWRTDDGNLNNWPKRDSSGKANRTAAKRRHHRPPSRSRSRSPAESYQSHRSSRGRSRSRSNTPKRKRGHSNSTASHNRAQSQRGRRSWNTRRDRSSSKSPSSPRPARVAHKRSLSSPSSTSRSRSTSRSPAERPRAVHRLPPATSLADIPLSTINLTRATSMRPPRDIPHRRNGKNLSNGKHANRAPASHHHMNYGNTQASSMAAMGPPPDPVTPVNPMAVGLPEISSTSGASDPGVGTSKRGRFGSVKIAGFRPIGQANSSVKKFFPVEDEDDEIDRIPGRFNRSRSRAPDLASDEPNHPEARGDDLARSSITEHTDESSLQRHTLRNAPSSPQQARRTSFQTDSQPQKEARINERHGGTATPTWPPQILECEGNEPARHSPPSRSSRNELYSIINQVGEGTFGKVYKARNTVTNVHVALKRIRMEAERDGFPVTAMREIKLLQSLRHGNIVRLYEMMVSEGSVYMVFEYMDHDLTGILSQTQFSFTEAHLKSLCQQMLAGLAYLHHKGVIHRDIKGSNILINNRGELKLADFGLARFYQKRRRSDYTNRVITLWYRPPELLFGATVYGPEVDMWSAGCIMLELHTKKPIFQGNDEIHQLDVIYKIIGTPTPERWLSVTDLPWHELVKPKEVIHNHFRELFQKWLSPAGLDLAEKLLSYDPTQRVTALQALEAPYFTEEYPPPMPPVGLSTLQGEWHELETKRERAKKRRKTEPAIQ